MSRTFYVQTPDVVSTGASEKHYFNESYGWAGGLSFNSASGVMVIPMAAMIGAMGAIQISAIASQQYQGQAHAGIDKIPASGDQTWNLKGGERIIQPKANMDLTNYLKSNQNKAGGDTNVSVQNHFAGSFIDEGGFAEMVARQPEAVVAALAEHRFNTGG